jgi:2-iminobutanoate/2-iminopropanoate deaminase
MIQAGSMSREVVTNEELAALAGAPELIRQGRFSPAVIAGPFVFISGIAARDLALDIRGQTAQVFDYLTRVLGASGSHVDQVVKLGAFLSSAGNYEGYSEVRSRFFPVGPPASTTIIAELLLPGMLVEVDAVAYRGER